MNTWTTVHSIDIAPVFAPTVCMSWLRMLYIDFIYIFHPNVPRQDVACLGAK